MSAVAAVGRRYLPRGWVDFGRQLVIWFGFLLAYQVARGVADRNPAKAFDNGWRVLGVEQGMTHHIFELTLQRITESSSVLNRLASLTYWLSEFAVVGLALLYVYVRRHESFKGFRNWILIANGLGLIGSSASTQYITTGLILLAAVTLDTVSRHRLAASGR